MAAKAVNYLGNIWIWESSIAYRREVEKVLSRVRTTQAGRTLLKHINKKPQYILISPFRPTKESRVNAYANPRSGADAAPAGFVVSTIEITVPFVDVKLELPTSIGTGKGSHVDVIYHPATWHQVAKVMGHIPPGGGAGEVMFHEMLHGFREQSGLLRYRDQVEGEERMTSVEEFFAIMASNVYRSDRGFTKLRADHWGETAIQGSLTYQNAYYDHYKSYIDTWFKEQRDFCLDMAHVPAKFNPFREAAVQLKLMPGSAVSMRL